MARCGIDPPGRKALDTRAVLTALAAVTVVAAGALAQPASRPALQPTSRPAQRLPHHRQAARLIKQLELPSLRADAVNKLLRLGKDAAPDLGRALHDPRPDVVLCVAQMLRMLGPDAKPALADMQQLLKSSDKKLANAARYAMSGVSPAGITVVPVYDKGELRELDDKGNTLRTIRNLPTIFAASRLVNGNYLVCLINQSIVKEINAKGDEVWVRKDVGMPAAAKRLPNGNTLICESSKNRVIEVDSKNKVVWEFKSQGPYDADRLPSGNTLISDYTGHRVIEVNAKGKIVWKLTGIRGAISAERLPNGNTLICEMSGRRTREVDSEGNTVLEIKNLTNPYAALRLPNGHTLVASTKGVSEYDKKGKRVWNKTLGVIPTLERY